MRTTTTLLAAAASYFLPQPSQLPPNWEIVSISKVDPESGSDIVIGGLLGLLGLLWLLWLLGLLGLLGY